MEWIISISFNGLYCTIKWQTAVRSYVKKNGYYSIKFNII